ncbi:carbohydrate kinase (thermoresistant glucokinase family) [Microbacterium ginsengiterrae]|uniref:Gluconokinase n=1 Tax=Microbacterium ginsengiterrae TaxID=546115 RepID=A0A7W9CA57_9MICO|nr:gluconokinase [Microbacterium ginsengiterrae]MBB5741832.1 carbohydrate kinase (thermoresistant glucokinase family) [Microbacterium ginsengiterrae]
MRIVVMGPSGSGKSTVGQALADATGARFVDGDDLHPPANVAKMSAGIPLDDDDRHPWLRLVGMTLGESDHMVIACSALRRRYRDLIRAEAPDVLFAELAIDRTVLEERMRTRAHFMPTSLLDSQLETLESLHPDECGVQIDGSAEVGEAVAHIADVARTTLPASRRTA